MHHRQMTSSGVRRPGRAAPMAPDQRRQAILDAVVPLLLEHTELSTRRIAEAAGIAEGTIFRVFEDKSALLLAAAEQALDPEANQAQLDACLVGAETIRDRVVGTARHLSARSDRVTAVLMALRRSWSMQPPAEHRHAGPPPFLEQAQRTTHEQVRAVLAPHAHALTVDPDVAATVLTSLVLGSRHPGCDPSGRLAPEQVADVLLDGIRRRDEVG
jgi:AcrR family transcriptional regulator